MSNEFAMHVLKEMGEMTSNPDNQKAFEEEIELQKKRREKVDELSIRALCAMSTAMETIEKVLVENDTTIEQISDLTGRMASLGMSMGHLRMNMGGIGYVGTSCGYAV
ncbi:MAG: hypothetical protein IKK34_03095 [Clostridia bacterium]|nr:hypothetical protein [Clostridia bacterium]